MWSLFIHSCCVLDRWWISWVSLLAQALPELPAVVYYGIANTKLGVTQVFALCGPQSFSTSTFPCLVYQRNWGICFCADCRSDHDKHFSLFIVRLLHEYVTVTSPTKTNTNRALLFSNLFVLILQHRGHLIKIPKHTLKCWLCCDFCFVNI